MPNLSSLLLGLLTMIFVVFGSTRTSAEEPTKTVYILADASGSMFDEALSPIAFQTQGVVTGLRSYAPCTNIRVVYIPWGTQPAEAIIGDLDGVSSLVSKIENATLNDLGDTRPAAAWSKFKEMFQSGSPTAVVILTNGSGKDPVRGPAPAVTLFKVAILSEPALKYLSTQFMPGVSEPIYADSVEQIAQVIEEALRSVDVMCLS